MLNYVEHFFRCSQSFGIPQLRILCLALYLIFKWGYLIFWSLASQKKSLDMHSGIVQTSDCYSVLGLCSGVGMFQRTSTSFIMGCRGRIYVQLSWAVSNWAVECEQWRNLLMCMGSLVTEATLHYSKWEVRQVQSWSLPQTETETGKGNSIFIVLPRFREKKFHNSLLSLAPLGCIEKTTQIWGNGSVGQVLASKCKDPSCTQGPIKISHDVWL